jgi:hypothetical protein
MVQEKRVVTHMKPNDIDELAKLISNTRTKKRSLDLVEISELVNKAVIQYGGIGSVAKKLGMSKEMVRQFTIPIKLPKEVKTLIKERKIDSIEVVKLIYGIQGEEDKIRFANAVIGLNSSEVRDFKRLVLQSKLSLDEARKIIVKAQREMLHVMILLIDDETYKTISMEAKKSKDDEISYTEKIVTNWASAIREESKKKGVPK